MIEFSKVKQAFIKHMCEDVNNDKTIGKVVFKLLVFPTTKKHLAGNIRSTVNPRIALA